MMHEQYVDKLLHVDDHRILPQGFYGMVDAVSGEDPHTNLLTDHDRPVATS